MTRVHRKFTAEFNTLVVIILVLIQIAFATLAHAEQLPGLSEDLTVLFESGSNQYRLGNKLINRRIEHEKVNNLCASDDSEVAELAELVKTKIEQDQKIIASMHKIQNRANIAAGEMQLYMMGFFLDEIFSDGSSTHQNAQRFMNNITSPVGSVVDSQTSLFDSGTEQVLHEAVLREKLKELHGVSESSDGAESLFGFRIRLDPDTKEHVAISVQNKSGEALPESLIVIEIDYKTSEDARKTLENLLGTGVLAAAGVDPLNAASLGLSYENRNQSQQKFNGLDKGACAFLREWKRGEFLELRLDTVMPFLLYTQAVRISVLSKDTQLVDQQYDLDTGKKEVWKLYMREMERRKKAAKSRMQRGRTQRRRY